MHELSISLSIIELAQNAAQKNNARIVSGIEIDLGKDSGVDSECLLHMLDVATKNTILSGSAIKINVIESQRKCLDCNEVYAGNYCLECPSCKSFRSELISGDELRLKSITID